MIASFALDVKSRAGDQPEDGGEMARAGNGQVERMNRTFDEATVKRFRYEGHEQLRAHPADFMEGYNFACWIKASSGLKPYDYIAKISTPELDRFIVDPIYQIPGLNAWYNQHSRASTTVASAGETVLLTFCS